MRPRQLFGVLALQKMYFIICLPINSNEEGIVRIKSVLVFVFESDRPPWHIYRLLCCVDSRFDVCLALASFIFVILNLGLLAMLCGEFFVTT